tara:strand:- start:111 stop:428 length:318 start_codon:yes stop_codon:yes gene_type:complete
VIPVRIVLLGNTDNLVFVRTATQGNIKMMKEKVRVNYALTAKQVCQVIPVRIVLLGNTDNLVFVSIVLLVIIKMMKEKLRVNYALKAPTGVNIKKILAGLHSSGL